MSYDCHIVRVIVIGLGLAVGACATPEEIASSPDGIHDPFEEANREFFAFNEGLDQAVVRPASIAYKTVVPEPLRLVVHNLLGHLGEPVTFLNEVLQGELKQAEGTFWRFAVNSTLGGLGALDPATELGLPAHDEDFGQTLATYGVNAGPYFVLPLLGPSTLRHYAGRAVDTVVDPVSYIGGGSAPFITSVSRTALSVLDYRAENGEAIDSLQASSPDFYAAVRSGYYQRRRAAIANGVVDADSLPDIGID